MFYNRLLRCYVLIDFKTGKLTHQDLGQMQQIEEREEFLERADALAATTSGVKQTDGTILIREDRDR